MGIAKQMLLSKNYFILEKELVYNLGIETAFLLASFAEAEQMLADDEGWFYQTMQTVEQQTTLSRRKQEKCIKILLENKLIQQKNIGLPPKRYFKINEEELEKLLNSLYNPLKSINCTKRTNYNVQNVQIKLHEMYNNKESINKESINKENIYISVPELTQEQINKLNKKYPDIDIEYYIEKIKDYEERKNKKYSSYYITALNWIKKDIERNNTYSKIVTIKEKENKEVENELNFDF